MRDEAGGSGHGEALTDAKRSLRGHMRAMCETLSESRRRAASSAVARRLLREIEPHRSPRWAVYAALGDELSLRPLFDALQVQGRMPLLPRIRGRAIEFVPVRCWSDLRVGRFGVLEPGPGRRAECLRPGDVAILPGRAFDRAGYRLGRGGGFYDRAFRTAGPRPLLVGAAYTFQFLSGVPHGSHDGRVDAIVTEHGLFWPRGRR